MRTKQIHNNKQRSPADASCIRPVTGICPGNLSHAEKKNGESSGKSKNQSAERTNLFEIFRFRFRSNGTIPRRELHTFMIIARNESIT